jgi:hypothetical protein
MLVNHKLRFLVGIDLEPGRVTLEVGGCPTQANFPRLTLVEAGSAA